MLVCDLDMMGESSFDIELDAVCDLDMKGECVI